MGIAQTQNNDSIMSWKEAKPREWEICSGNFIQGTDVINKSKRHKY